MSDDKQDAGKENIKTDLEFYSDGETFDPAEERRLLRKLDLKLIPFLALLYLCSFLDRVNIDPDNEGDAGSKPWLRVTKP
ncbi:hypothetical protein BC937DRAFT_89966 [Endogone sp. FLAS-F59071]|nr:hypothetical protein BC937DRAFT_89966 [Endogone sp. FLAS-F59071]|eukprot:RUS17452.1 hypothetical protein BC937DRAFT_89966 [Endogone sp. FLAS-F59071]